MSFKDIHQGFRLLGDGPEFAYQYQDNGAAWPSPAAAHAGVPADFIRDGSIRYIDFGDGKGRIEYWYKGGVTVDHLVPKYPNQESAQAYVDLLNSIKNAVEQLKTATEAAAIVAGAGREYKGIYKPGPNAPTLSADASVGSNWVPGVSGKPQWYAVVETGILQFDVKGYPQGTSLPTGVIVEQPDKTWGYEPVDSAALARLNQYELSILLTPDGRWILSDSTGAIGFELTPVGTLITGPIEAISLKLGGVMVDLTKYADKDQFTRLNDIFKLDENGKVTIADPLGWPGLEFENGNLKTVQLIAQLLNAAMVSTQSVDLPNATIRDNPDYDLAISDPQGDIGWVFTKPEVPRIYGILADVMHFVVYGQSLSVGQEGLPFVSVHQVGEDYVITFLEGPYMYLHDGSATKYNDFKLATEEYNETPCNAMGRMIKQQITAKTPIGPNNKCELLVSAAGQGGWSLANLSKPGTAYNRFMNGVINGRALANSKGKTYNCPAVLWIQGENETGARMPKSIYKDGLKKLRATLDADIKAANPAQKNDLIFLVYQLASFNVNSGGNPHTDIALGLMEVARTERYFYPGPVMYPYKYKDNTHLLNGEEYAKVGALAGYILDQIIVEGVEWTGIDVKETRMDGTFLDIIFTVPVKPLVLEDDPAVIVDPGNKGFRLYDAAGAELSTITSVSVVRPDTVRIVSSTPFQAGQRVTYAINGMVGKSGPTEGARGCLRDSQGTQVVYKPGVLNWPLHNFCPIFELYLK